MGAKAVGAAALGAAAGLQLIGGFQANREARRQARIARQEAAERARARERDIKKFKSRQIVSFLKSGVELSGTPLAVLEETERLGAEEVASLLRSGEERARASRLEGRARLLSGISGGIRTGAQAAAGGGG